MTRVVAERAFPAHISDDQDALLVATGWERRMMQYLHTMVRVADLEKSLGFYCTHLVLLRHKRRGGREGGGIVWAQQGHRGSVGARA